MRPGRDSLAALGGGGKRREADRVDVGVPSGCGCRAAALVNVIGQWRAKRIETGTPWIFSSGQAGEKSIPAPRSASIASDVDPGATPVVSPSRTRVEKPFAAASAAVARTQ